VQAQEERKAGLQTRIADGITRFAGSMFFVYVHIVWFALWIVVGIEKFPYGLLTMIVSLEAIFLSTFVMISQNRPTSVGRCLRTTSGRRSRWKRTRTRS
jgi:uncharacterized membrane protein